MAGQFVKNGATLSCPLCSSSGTLMVSHTQVQLQDTPCATNGDRGKTNLVFAGVCKKWRKNPPPCASVIAPTQWKGVATDVEIDGEFMLLEDSTITCSTGGVDIKIDDTAQMDVPTDLPDSENTVLKKFLVNIRRPDDYQGEYGFDWMRDEYIYPIETVQYDSSGNEINAKVPICINMEDLKQEYKTKDIPNPIVPYGVDYYPSWLSIWPTDTSEMHNNGVDLDIEIEEVEPLENDATQIIFEPANGSVMVSPNQIPLQELLVNKQTKDLGEKSVDYYRAEKKINISCNAAVDLHTEIKIFAELEGEKEEVGKLMIYKNSEPGSMEIVVVDVTIGTSFRKTNSFIAPLVRTSFTQALVQPGIIGFNNFDINELPNEDPEVLDFKNKYLQNGGVINTDEVGIYAFEDAFLRLFNRYGETGNPFYINHEQSKRTYIFRTPFQLTNPITGYPLRGFAYVLNPVGPDAGWGNSIILTPFGLEDDSNIIHELGHSLSLPHTFHDQFTKPFVFHQGFTDNHMDYFNQYHPTPGTLGAPNKQTMNSFYKWQWDIIREDASLIYENTTAE